jgi:predicted amidohydrolase YtcJ
VSDVAGPVTTVVGAQVVGPDDRRGRDRVVDVRLEGGRIAAVGPDLERLGTRVVDAGGAALVPGLHDHHLHLLAMAAADRSVDVGGAAGPAGFDAALRSAAAAPGTHRWLRVVGYHEGHGPLDRHRLDRLVGDRPVRVQHRSGAAWVLGTAALDALGVPHGDGWLHRADDRLAGRWPDDGPPDLAAVARRLAARGVTGVTDATPFADGGGPALLAAARAGGDLPQRVAVTGGPERADAPAPDGLELGPVKVVVADHDPPSPDALAAAFRRARAAGRAVAVHCVTRVGLVLALAAWAEVGAVPGDRIEHGSVVPVELIAPIAELGLRVVTQPAFCWARGDRYLDDVEPDDVPHLYRCRSLLAAGIPVAGSTDAPFGPEDPWRAVAAAAERRTATGRPIGLAEAIAPRRALDAFLAPLDDPGGAPRRIVPGAPADLCLLDGPFEAVLADPATAVVRATWIAGRVVHGEG